jgi:hypothetical protein
MFNLIEIMQKQSVGEESKSSLLRTYESWWFLLT